MVLQPRLHVCMTVYNARDCPTTRTTLFFCRCFTPRYARESHTRAYLANDNDCSKLLSSKRLHDHPQHLASPHPRIASARLLLDSCARRLVARTSPTLSGRGSSGVHDGAVCFAFAAAWNCVRVALSLDASSSDGGGSSGTHTEPVHLSCLLVARSPAKALGGSSGIERWTMCFAPFVRWPPLVCAQQ